MPKDRSNSYYLPRLEREHPAIHADWKAGKYRSAREALIAAGLKRDENRLNALKAAWKKASRAERRDFAKWVAAAARPAREPIVGADSKLLPKAAERIRAIMSRRNLKLGKVMDEMGFNRHDGSLGYALGKKRARLLQPDMIKGLEKWLDDNGRW